MEEVSAPSAASAPGGPATRLGGRFRRPAATPSGRSVCLYTPSVDPSGMGAHMLDLAAVLRRTASVSLMAWPTPGGRRLLDRAARLGLATLALPRPRDPSFAGAILEFLRDRPADVFHIHVGTGRENWDGARAARRAGVPVVVQTQHLPWLLASRRKRRSYFAAVEPVDLVIAVSEGLRRTYERIGVPAERLATVPNGVRPRTGSPGRSAARAALALAPDRPVVMTVGRLEVMKGQRYLVDAVPGLAARFPGLAVLIAGEGHLKDELAARARELGVERAVRLLGHRSDARMLLDAADVFVLPSLHEGMPLAAIEAMEAGLPVVATRALGTDEVVADGETGLLVPPRDAAALDDALGRLLDDPRRRARMGERGRRRYGELFTSERMGAETLRLYEALLARAGAAAAAAEASAGPGR